MSKWNTTKLLAIASLAVIGTVLSLMGGAIVAMTGIPGSGLTNAIIMPMLLVFCCFIIKKFGAATLMGLIVGILALPLPTGGPPGFFPKILLLILIGLITDIVFFFFKRKGKLLAIVAGIITVYVAGFMIAGFGILFKLPGAEEFVALIPKLSIAGLPFGIIAGYLAYLLYNKLKNTAIVKRIQV